MRVWAYIEITPFDLVKYEVDKASGYLKVDRAQRTSSLPPSLYGFIPQTYAGPSVAALMSGATGGDLDPLDICVLSERPIRRAEVLLRVKVVGGLPMLDGGEADDKILAVPKGDPRFDQIYDLADISPHWLDEIANFFNTYNTLERKETRIVGWGSAVEAVVVVQESFAAKQQSVAHG